MSGSKRFEPGLRSNWQQFTLLVIVNAFVGGMVGMERSIFPQYAEQAFNVASNTALLSFIMAFGITKAFSNYMAGRLANHFGRRNLLITGWLLAIPVPLILIYAPAWGWVVFANMLLGVSQGLAWSSTVVMKIDLAGEKDRGLAMGLNEFAGYFAVGLVAWITGRVAGSLGIIPYPFYIGLGLAIAGLMLTLLFVKDTRAFVHHEQSLATAESREGIFLDTTFRDKTLSTVTQAGLVNNLNDGMIWGLLPVLLFSLQFDMAQIGILAAIYPTVWGIAQLFTGKMADHFSRKAMLFWGMLLQGLAIFGLPFVSDFYALAALSALLGLGTALVYPTFLTVIASATTPLQRAESIGVFRLWRDLGYAVGALISGVVADAFGVQWAVLLIGGLTIVSALIIRFRMPSSPAEQCVKPEKLIRDMNAGKSLYIVDVRSPEEFSREHIQDALNIPLNELAEKANLLESGFEIVTACAKGGGRSAKAAELLKSMGFHARWLCGGTEGMPEPELVRSVQAVSGPTAF